MQKYTIIVMCLVVAAHQTKKPPGRFGMGFFGLRFQENMGVFANERRK